MDDEVCTYSCGDGRMSDGQLLVTQAPALD